MTKLALLCLAMAACSNGIPTSQKSTLHPTSKAKMPAATKTAQAFPTRSGPADLPTAEALHAGRREGAALSTQVELCVAPSGDTVGVSLRQSSGDSLFDRAVIRDASRWHYEPFSSDGSVCEPATVTYVP